MLSITLPWPPSALSPNARHHWRVHAKAKKAYREACSLTAMSQGATQVESDELAVALVFVPPNRRARDLDNCIAAMKSGLDGLADVLGVNDNRWTLTAVLDREQIGGFVRVSVSGYGGADASP